MRLIDADAVAKDIRENNRENFHKLDWSSSEVCQLLESAPVVDAVPVVRCKDCKHYRNHPNGMCYAWTEPCTNERGYKGEVHCVEPDDFCSYGERRADGNTD